MPSAFLDLEAARYLVVRAAVRYWEDATVNGVEDGGGSLIPCCEGDLWVPVIRLEDGQIMDWPSGVEADVHYKVCDEGQYYLADDSGQLIGQWRDDYVPDSLLCPAESGFGDYIVLSIDAQGLIRGWDKNRNRGSLSLPPVLNPTMWRAIDHRETVKDWAKSGEYALDACCRRAKEESVLSTGQEHR